MIRKFHISHDRCLNLANAEFEIPITAQCSVSGQVVAGRDIGAGQRMDSLQQLLSFPASRKVAAVNQQIAIVIERITPRGDSRLAGLQGVVIQPGITQLNAPVVAVRNDMHSRQCLLPGECATDLADTVIAGIEHQHVDSAPRHGFQAIDQKLIIRCVRIDNDQFVCLDRHIRNGRNCIGQVNQTGRGIRIREIRGHNNPHHACRQ